MMALARCKVRPHTLYKTTLLTELCKEVVISACIIEYSYEAIVNRRIAQLNPSANCREVVPYNLNNLQNKKEVTNWKLNCQLR